MEPSEQSEQSSTVTEYIVPMLENAKDQLNENQLQDLSQLLCKFQDVFEKDEFDLGIFTTIEHSIQTGQAKPIKEKMRCMPACFAGKEEAHLKMLATGVIQPSISDWASAQVLIWKRDGNVRWCIDYRGLNSVTEKDVLPLPLVDGCLDTLAGNKLFSKLNANSTYWQTSIKKSDRKKTAFITKY